MQRSPIHPTLNIPNLEGITRTAPKGKTVYYEGETPTGIIFIKSGFIKIITTDNIRGTNIESARVTKLLDIKGPGEFIGFSNGPYAHHAVTGTETTFTLIDASYVRQHRTFEALMDFVHKNERRHEWKRYTNDFNVMARMVFACQDFTERFGGEHGVTPPIPVTQQEFADLVLATRVTVTRLALVLREHGLMTPVNGKGQHVFRSEGSEKLIATELNEMFGTNDKDTHDDFMDDLTNANAEASSLGGWD